MIRAVLAVFAGALLAYPVICLLDLEAYRGDLEDLYGSAGATEVQLQTVAAIHWLKNAYLAFAFLLLARYVGVPARPGDLSRAGALIMAFPIIHILWQVLAQVAMASDPEELDLNIQLNSHYLFYCMLGLSLVGIARTVKGGAAPDTSNPDEVGTQA
ncbi:MAG: hypothetical protein QNI86_05220 [Halieaceae bacterium]|nr:hypothetical protein [Halieaceae bacterium]